MSPAPAMLDPRLQALADNIRRLITASGYKPIDVAKEIGVDRSAVSRWMSGGRTPTVQNLIDLAALLDRELHEFWEGPQATPTTPEQKAMIDRMAHMPPEQQQALLALAATLTPKP